MQTYTKRFLPPCAFRVLEICIERLSMGGGLGRGPVLMMRCWTMCMFGTDRVGSGWFGGWCWPRPMWVRERMSTGAWVVLRLGEVERGVRLWRTKELNGAFVAVEKNLEVGYVGKERQGAYCGPGLSVRIKGQRGPSRL